MKKSQIGFVVINFSEIHLPIYVKLFYGWLKVGIWIRAKLDFFKHHFLKVFEKWDPDNFPKIQMFKMSRSIHSENAHIKLNGFQSIFGGWGDMPLIFLWAGC